MALTGGVARADDRQPQPPDRTGTVWTSQSFYSTKHLGRALTSADPIAATFKLNSQYWRCTQVPTVPSCWHISTLSFWTQVDLGYRHHRVVGRSAVTYGGVPWGAWTGKSQRMICAEGGSGVFCGSWMRVPHPKNVWSKPKWYKAFRLMSGDWFRFQASACFDSFCGAGFNASVPVYCRPRLEQCYFDVP